MSLATEERARSIGRTALNRVIGRCSDEIAALNEAAGVCRGGERAVQFQQRAQGRAKSIEALRAGVVALGGVPSEGGSYTEKVSSSWRAFKRLFTGPHAGDVYAVCARAAAKTSAAYATALEVELPSDLRLRLERQHRDVEVDYRQLRRLRWGASPYTPAERDSAAAELAGAELTARL